MDQSDWQSSYYEITDGQYQDLMQWMDGRRNDRGYGYDALVNNCVDFVDDAFDQLQLPSPVADLKWPILVPVLDYWENLIQESFGGSVAWRPDPLTLDLDGDGIETIAVDGYRGTLFDMNGDGVKTATGWVSGDDGFLVRDLNGNGTIDNGAELFGDSTVKSDGSTASSGFDALADLDSNSDGVIDASDAAFSELHVWRDMDSDGVSQADELFTLNELGIASLDLDNTSTNADLGDGNAQIGAGSFTRTDGTTGEMADLALQEQTIYSEFTDSVPLTDQAKLLPELKGMGMVRDLREAISLDDTGTLGAITAQYTAASTRGEQLDLLDELISAWAATSAFEGSSQPGVYYFGQTWGMPSDSGEERIHLVPTEVQYIFVGVASEDEAKWLERIQLLEKFTRQKFFDLENPNITPVALNNDYGLTSIYYYIKCAGQRLDLLEQSYTALKEYIYNGLLLQTRLKEFNDSITLSVDEGNLAFDFTALESVITTRIQQDAANGLIDLQDFLNIGGREYVQVGWDYQTLVRNTLSSVDLAEVAPEQAVMVMQTAGLLYGSQGQEVVVGSAGEDTVRAGEGHDVLLGEAGNDTLEGGAGNDLIYGDAGDDWLWGGADNDSLRGGSGNDHLYGEDGDDILDGGSGNDTLGGGRGSDIYLFGGGAGSDTISNYDRYAAEDGSVDRVVFGAGLTVDDIEYRRHNDDLVLSIRGTGDTLRVSSWFRGGEYRIEELVFSEGGRMPNADQIQQNLLTVKGTADADRITGYADDETFYGLDGNDTLGGRGGNDTLDGGGGNDTLHGEDGDDVLDGGAGNDTLNGGRGNDTYLFGRGSGNDTISDYDYLAEQDGSVDRVGFAPDLSAADIECGRQNNNLVLTIRGSGDTLTISNWLKGDEYRVEEFVFADGSQLPSAEQIYQELMTLTGTEGSDRLFGGSDDETFYGLDGNDTLGGRGGNDTLDGGGGNDTLYGEDGDDVLDGGAGNDTLNGGRGSDTYRFGRGSGADYISDYDPYAASDGSTDRLELAAGIRSDQLWFSRSGSHLNVGIIGTTDRVTIGNWYSADSYKVNEFHLADGSVLLESQVQQLVDAMAAFNPPAVGELDLPAELQNELQPVIAANWQTASAA